MCTKCGEIFICECDKEIALTLLPHHIKTAREFGTDVRYEIKGFLPNICETCRGLPETPNPMRYGNKIDRYYWREISKTYYLSILEWLKRNNVKIQHIREFESKYPNISKKLKSEAKQTWTKFHKKNPKYDMIEPTQDYYLKNIQISSVEIPIKFKIKKFKKNITTWLINNKEYEILEAAITHFYKNEGYNVWFCESKLISTLIGVFGILAPHYNPGIRLSWNHITENWPERYQINENDLLNKYIRHGTREYYLRQELEVNNLINILTNTKDLIRLFEFLLQREINFFENKPRFMSLREQLGGEEEYSIELTRDALENVPHNIILKMIKWVILDFYERRNGWPDLLCTKSNKYKFVEVKSPRDKIRPEQFDWFNWAFEEGIECELCQIKMIKSLDN
jgi:hypothetical protein